MGATILKLVVVRQHRSDPIALLELYGGVEVNRVKRADFYRLELRRAPQCL